MDLHQPESGVSLPTPCRGLGVCVRRGRARASDLVTSQMTDSLLKCWSPAQTAPNASWGRMGKGPRVPSELHLEVPGGIG